MYKKMNIGKVGWADKLKNGLKKESWIDRNITRKKDRKMGRQIERDRESQTDTCRQTDIPTETDRQMDR